jgi:predicted regulator of Ras-like GTPase activity (Roadblock/LC7/MglB family)
MDAARALADLTEISSQIEGAVVFSAGGEVLGSTLADEAVAAELVRGAAELLEAAGGFRSEGVAVTQLEASLPDGSLFVVREGEHGIVATTTPRPTTGLVFYDLKSCLRGAAETAKPKRRRRASPKKAADGTEDAGAS